MRTWLVVAAERREFDGILKCFGTSFALDWPHAKFARESRWRGDRWLLIANGPGPGLVHQALAGAALMKKPLTEGIDGRGQGINGNQGIMVTGIISTGLCGALDPSLGVGDIVVSVDSSFASASPFIRGQILSTDRVAVTAAEKRKLRARTGAVAVEMESAAVAAKAAELGVPFYCIRAVSDPAVSDLPLDFNFYRDADGRFSRTRIALTAVARPFSVMPRLLAFDRDCRRAAEALGEFLVDCRF